MNPLTHRLRLVAALLALSAAVGLLAAADDKPADEKEVARLIDQLGDEDTDVRRVADDKLRALGEPVLEALRKAIKDHPDPDVKLRAIVLIEKIKKGAFGEQRAYKGHTGHVRSLALSKDGKRLLSGAMDGTVRLWDVETGKELKKFDIPNGWAWQVAFSPDEKEVLASGGKEGQLHRFDAETGKALSAYKFPAMSWVYGAAYSRDGKHVYGGAAGKDADFAIRRFEADTGKEDGKLVGHTGFVWRLARSSDGKKLASIGCNDSSFRVWEADTGKELVTGKEAHEGYAVGLEFSPDGRTLLTSGRDSFVKLWDAESGKLLTTYKGLSGDAEAVAWSSDGKRFLASDGRVVHVFEKDSGKVIHRFEDHPEKVYAVAFHPDGRRALSAGEDLVIRLWGVPK